MPVTASDDFSAVSAAMGGPYEHAVLITPSDSDDVVKTTRAVYVGGAGNMKVTTKAGDTLLISGIPAGTTLPLRVTRIWSTTTTATLIVTLT